MPMNFPSSPSVNQTYTSGTRTWQWDGSMWRSVVGGGSVFVLTRSSTVTQVPVASGLLNLLNRAGSVVSVPVN